MVSGRRDYDRVGAFLDLQWEVQEQANALLAPADVPVRAVERLVTDAAGNRVKWSFVPGRGWKGVQVS
ncbi:MAG TPA: hypothetical protein VHI93_01440 [Candidatus Thermoplasmatota archaeon]|nr:hypothetical protein [Candidatus Thermoplasmatota archaeon]